MVRLRSEFGVYGTDTGRMCVAALNSKNIDYVCQAIAKVMACGPRPLPSTTGTGAGRGGLAVRAACSAHCLARAAGCMPCTSARRLDDPLQHPRHQNAVLVVSSSSGWRCLPWPGGYFDLDSAAARAVPVARHGPGPVRGPPHHAAAEPPALHAGALRRTAAGTGWQPGATRRPDSFNPRPPSAWRSTRSGSWR
jgi:hypothetical protein